MGKYLDMIRLEEKSQRPPVQDQEPIEERSDPVRALSLIPGNLITWQGADGKQRGPATVDFVHTDSDRTSWAFYSLPDGGWGAVNTKYLTSIERG